MSSTPFLVVGSSTSVDTDELIGALVVLDSLIDDIDAVIVRIDSAIVNAGDGAVSAPDETWNALARLADARDGVAGMRELAEALRGSLAYAAAILDNAEGEAARLLSEGLGARRAGDHRFGRNLDLVPSGVDVDDAWPAEVFMPPPLRLSAIVRAARVADIFAAIEDFTGHDGDGLLALRLQTDLDALNDDLVSHTWLAWGDRSALEEGPGTRGAAILANSWMFGLGFEHSGRSTGVTISTGAKNGTGRRSVHIDAEDRPTHGGFIPPTSLSGALGGALANHAALAAVPLLFKKATTGVIPRRDSMVDGMDPHLVETPRTPSQALHALDTMCTKDNPSQIKILRHETPAADGAPTRSWSVIIRGTQEWGPGSQNPQDLLTNLQAVAGQDSDQRRAVLAAMEMSGIQPGESVELVGHSQGGIIANQLAADPDVASTYTVRSVLTAGSPVALDPPAPGVRRLALENTGDIVPALDGMMNTNPEGSATVFFDGTALVPDDDPLGSAAAHSNAVYTRFLRGIESDPSAVGGGGAEADGLADVRVWEEGRARALGLSDDTMTTAFVYDTRRTYW